MRAALQRAATGRPLSDDDALALAELSPEALAPLLQAAAAVRDDHYGARLTYSPKVFIPLTNLCRNRCDYCSFRKSPGDPGAWTMTHPEVQSQLQGARQHGCVEALFCIGDKPEKAFGAYRQTLAQIGHEGTVDYLDWAGRQALSEGLLPHTNAGVLDYDDMRRLRETNVSLGLMLENVSPRLCERGMPHHRAPDKRPDVRLRMLREAGELRIPFTTGILIGIGETRRERVQSLLAIRALHRRFGHIQEVIVQNFTPRPEIAMADAPQAADPEMLHAVAMARLVLDADVGVQAPPNLNPHRTGGLLSAGINDFGGISPLTPDYINPRHPWPHLQQLQGDCEALGFALRPRLPVYDAFLRREGWVQPQLVELAEVARARLDAGHRPEAATAAATGMEAQGV